ncbi:MAG: hypothetical protein JKY43_05700 [Phycisphaerales bacterium]|nr:hypothetical protein [Phycisphaerales bacterium]
MTSNSSSNSSNNRRSGDRRKDPNGAPPPGTVIDRRLGLESRASNSPTDDSAPTTNGKLVTSKKSPNKKTATTGLERKRGRGRRLSEFTKSAEEGEMTPEQFLFLMAIDAFKKGNDRMFPTWTDVLEVVRLLGYRKTMGSELNLTNAEDWRESPHTPANVRPDRWASRFTAEESDQITVGSVGPKSLKTESELTDEALEAFEAAFGPENEIDEDFTDASINEDFTDLEDDLSEAA